jgi:hypothetical protein
MEAAYLQPIGLIALAGAMILTLYDLNAAMKPETCSECPHCRAIAEADAREQEELRREYARRVGLADKDDDDRRIG